MITKDNNWPVLSYEKGKTTYETLHMWTQIIGKIKMGALPWINHSWHVALHITITGLTTLSIPSAEKNFQIDLDFVNHQLLISTSEGETRGFSLQGISVSDFYHKIRGLMRDLAIDFRIRALPSEILDPIPFEFDYFHAVYDIEQVSALHLALLKIQDVFQQFRSEFRGKTSPILFFWGSFDLALGLFSGEAAPKHPGGIPGLPDWVAEDAYNREVANFGFWPGNETFPEAAFYSYVYPEPEGYKTAAINPDAAFYHPLLKEYIMPYAAVQTSASGQYALLQFLHTTYRAAAIYGKWNRELL
ncbi:DUF5996 family protein [Pedobacter sp.]|uniref:DUF5996 family protein n=1 Tax=Pedobacter sp. TaxID=1411316 RepID=UPI003D7FAF61